MDVKRPEWSSYLSFIIATVGSAVGLGNIWRFPYVMGKNGGAVFLCVYLLIIAFICVIPLCLELQTGKKYRLDPIGCYAAMSPKLKWLGYLCLFTAILIPCFYFVVGGWIINYIWVFLTGVVPSDFSGYFNELNSNPYVSLILTFLFIFLTAIFPFRGVNKGIEKANNVMMPMFAVMLIGLAIYALTLPGAIDGLKFMFMPDFSAFNKNMFLAALGQALFTLSVGMGTMLTYGSYMKQETNVKKSAYNLIFYDTIVAILAGIMIFPIVFSNGIEPTAGPSLVFISLPQIFVNLPFTRVLAVVFFLLLFFAAITSGISLVETSVSIFVDYFKMTRKKATVLLSILIAVFAIPASLSFGVMSDVTLFGKTVFDLYDYLTSNILLPFNTLVICLVGGWFAKSVAIEAFGENFFGNLLRFILKFILPVFLVFFLIMGF